MHYELLENIAQKNALRDVSPYIKLAVGLGSIILTLLSTSFITPLVLAITLSTSLLVIARIDLHLYRNLLAAPLLFAVVSVAAIVLITGKGEVFWNWQPFAWLSLSITSHSVNQGLLVFSRVMGGMCAMFFIALTTPMTELFIVMRQCHVPSVILDLAMIIYRSIYILIDQVSQIRNAQIMRLGYSSPREALNSFGNLCGSVFIASWEEGEDLVRAMDARCYDGRFAMLGTCRSIEVYPLLISVVYLGGASVLLLTTGTVAFG